jgi:glycosyltransferase involved in cell wall biosynthesis
VPEPVPILFTHYGDREIRGSERVLLDLLAALDRSRYRPILWCNAEPMAEQARTLGVTVHRAPMRFFLCNSSPRLDHRVWRAQGAIARDLITRHGVRLLHANSAAPAQWLVPVARSLRLPLLVHLHAPYLRRDRFALLLHQADLIIGVSQVTIDALAADGMPRERLRVIPNGIDPGRVAGSSQGCLRARLAIPDGSIVVGCVGALVTGKGQDVVLRAVARLAAAKPVHLVLAGSGPEQERLAALAQELGIEDATHFLGNRKDMAQVYRAMDVNVLASRSEAFGLVLVEAGMHGVPSVASAVGGIPEVVEDGRTGLLFPSEDVEGLHRALQRIVADPALRSRLGEAARERAFARHTAARMTRDFEQAYEELLRLPASRLGWISSLSRAGVPYLHLPGRLLSRG